MMRMNVKKLVWIGVAMMMLISVVACSNDHNETTDKKEENHSVSQNENAKEMQTSYPLILKDASGAEVTFDKAPERIVSIAASETEVLFALGLNKQVVGVDDNSNYPLEATKKTKVGAYDINLESIMALKPDLIIGVESMTEEVFKKLRDLNQKVFTVDPKSIDQAMERIQVVGKITNRQKEADQVLQQMEAERKAVVDAVSVIKPADRKKVYFEIFEMWTGGKGVYAQDLIETINAINIAGEKEDWLQIDSEFVIKQNPDVMVYTSAMPPDEKYKQSILARKGWATTNAFKKNQVIPLDGDILSRPGPRITQGLRELAKSVYPELVK
jgi:iron complex transport system substrate-binding protein